jgi:CHAD domain-containing protein
LRYNEPGTRLGKDIEALHDMRVATRRMRAALRVFGDYYEPETVMPLQKGLKRTGRALGAVRDLDVFQVKIEDYEAALPEPERGGLDGLLAALDSKEYQRFVERCGQFVETEGLGSLAELLDGDEPRPYRVCDVAPVAVHESLGIVRAYDEWVTIPDVPLARLHALRIACKRLRYTLEFFREVLGPDTRSLIKEVVAMQDHLGSLQDAVVASRILRDYLVWGTWERDAKWTGQTGPETPVVAPGVAAYLAAKQAEIQTLLTGFPGAWHHMIRPEFRLMVAEAVAVP